jgi:hypothetical protein
MKIKSASAIILSLMICVCTGACNSVLPASSYPEDSNEISVINDIEETTTAPKPKPEKVTETTADPLATGKVINIYTWDEELASSILDLYTPPEGFTVNITTASEQNYAENLEKFLDRSDRFSPDQRVDLFLSDFEYVRRFVESDYALSLSEYGITADDTANMYPYTLSYGTDDNNDLKALTWFVSPDVFIFRRSLAFDKFGFKNIDGVEESFNTWEKMLEEASYLAALHYDGVRNKLFCSGAEFYRSFMQNANEPIVTDGVFNFPEKWDLYDSARRLLNNRGCTGMFLPGTDDWREQMHPDGITFAYVGSKALIDGVLSEEAAYENEDGESTFGDWAICLMPEGSAFGGTFLSVAESSDNPDIAADIIKAICLNEDNLRRMDIIPNNMNLVIEYAESPDRVSAILGGQNPYEVYHKAAIKIPVTGMTPYGDLGRVYAHAQINYFYTKKNAFDELEKYIGKNYPQVEVPFEENPGYVVPGVTYHNEPLY